MSALAGPCRSEPHPDRVRLALPAGRRGPRRQGGARPGRARRSSTPRAGTAIAIDSTCGGHGTCKKCKVRVVVRERADQSASTRARSRSTSCSDGWRLACRAAAQEDLVDRRAAAADAAEGGARRRRPPRDPAPGRAEALRRARRADARGPALRPRARARRRWTTSSCACRSTLAARRSAARCASRDWKVTAVVGDDLLIDVEPGDTTGAPARDRVRPRHDDGRRDPARPRDRTAARRCARC